MLSVIGVEHKAWGQNQHSSESNTFWSFNCKSFTTFPTGKVIDKQWTDRKVAFPPAVLFVFFFFTVGQKEDIVCELIKTLLYNRTVWAMSYQNVSL